MITQQQADMLRGIQEELQRTRDGHDTYAHNSAIQAYNDYLDSLTIKPKTIKQLAAEYQALRAEFQARFDAWAKDTIGAPPSPDPAAAALDALLDAIKEMP